MLSRIAIAACCLCIAVAGGALGMRVAGSSVHATALGDVAMTVEPAVPGRVDVFIPLANWGIRSHAFDAPLALKAQVRSVERQALLRAAGGDASVLEAARRDSRDAAEDALVRGVVWSTLGALLLVVVLVLAAGARLGPVRRRLLIVAGTTAAAAALSGGSAVLAAWTFDAAAFDQPDFYARGAELSQLLDVAAKSQQATDAYESAVDRTVSGYAKVLAGAARLVEGGDPPDSVGLLSDLHNNRPALRALEPAVSGKPVFFAGDLGHDGNDAEADLLVPELSRLGSQVIAVSGNHDSSSLMARLEQAGVTVLDAESVVVGGRRVAGWPDPLEWQGQRPDDPERIFSFAELPDGDAEFERAETDLISWFEGLEERPDIVMVHQNGLAQGLARHVSEQPDTAPLTILTGHDHQQHVDRYGAVIVVDAGSTGAGGIFGVGTEELGIANLDFRDTGLRAVDMIQLEPLSGAAQAERIVLDAPDACDKDLLICHDEGEEE